MKDDTLVRHPDGTLYILLKRSTDACLVREMNTDNRQYVPTELLEGLDTEIESEDISIQSTPDQELLEELHRQFAITDPRVPELLEYLEDEPVGVRRLLAETTFCESDLHGLLAELTAAGVLEQRRIAGERCYTITSAASNLPLAGDS